MFRACRSASAEADSTMWKWRPTHLGVWQGVGGGMKASVFNASIFLCARFRFLSPPRRNLSQPTAQTMTGHREQRFVFLFGPPHLSRFSRHRPEPPEGCPGGGGGTGVGPRLGPWVLCRVREVVSLGTKFSRSLNPEP